MLPSNLLRSKITRKNLFPLYVSPEQFAPLAHKLIESYKESIGRKKQLLIDRVSAIEQEEDVDYKLVRGLSTLLERNCVFETRSAIDSKYARRIVFELASKKFATTQDQVSATLSEASSILSIPREELDRSLWADLDGELFLKEFLPPRNPEELLKRYNLSLAQTTLFKCSRMEFTASGNWKRIFRSLKWLGLMYSIEEKDQDSPSSSPSNYIQTVSIDGPMSLFKMTDRYGVSLARLLPEIAKSDSWIIKAELLDRKKNRILSFEESSEHLKGMISTRDEPQDQSQFDSSVEEKFAKKFNALGTGWTLTREPEPLLVSEERTGKQSVIIPDFSFEIPEMNVENVPKAGTKKVYLEIVGFWTNEYMQRKLTKLSSLLLSHNNSQRKIDLLVAVDETLSCSTKLLQLGKLLDNADRIILYKNGNVPLQPIVKYLEFIEHKMEEEQITKLSRSTVDLVGDIVYIGDIASAKGVSLEAARSALNTMNFARYLKVGDYYLSTTKAYEIRERIEKLFVASDAKNSESVMNNSSSSRQGVSLADVATLVESIGLQLNANQLLDVLGYKIVWNGLDYDKSTVVHDKQTMSSAAIA